MISGPLYFMDPLSLCDEATGFESANIPPGSPKETSVSERHWEEEQRSVLGRLLDSIFGRREASEQKIDNEIRWLRTLQLKSRQDQPDDESAARSVANWPNRSART
jgi:hypothetical protein